jgi:hypothetical protein
VTSPAPIFFFDGCESQDAPTHVRVGMIQFFQDGGWSMFVILLFGVVALATAAFYAARPDARHEGFLKWMSRATLWATLAGVASDVGATCHATCQVLEPDERARMTTEGIAESMSPLVMGFALLALAAFLGAVGRRRLDAKTA